MLVGSLWGIVAMVILVLALMVPLLVLIAAMRGGAALARIIKVVSVGVIVVTTLAITAQIITMFSGGSVAVTVPVETIPVKVPAGVTFTHPPTATITDGGFTHVQVMARGLGVATQLELMGGMLLGGLTVIAICVVVLRLSNGLAAADPFALGARALGALGWIVLFGWTASLILTQVGEMSAAQDLFMWHGAELPSTWTPEDSMEDHGWPVPGSGLTLPLEPLGATLLLALLAAVFRHGERLRRDTDGLI